MIMDDYSHLYNDYYDRALSEKEIAFLVDNFSEFVDSTISSYLDGKVVSEPSRVEMIKKFGTPEKGATLFLANTGCDVACLFPDCKCEGYFCSEETPEFWAVGMIILFSKGISAKLQTSYFDENFGFRGINLPNAGGVDYLIYGAHENVTYSDILSLYKCVSPKGKMLLFVDKSEMQGKNDEFCELRKMLVDDKAISNIITYRDVDPLYNTGVNRLLLVIDKTGNDVVDIESLSSNRKITVSSSSLNPDMLWPGYYLATRPEDGVSLSKLCFTTSVSVRDEFKDFKNLLGGKLQWEKTTEGERLVLPDWMLNLQIATQSDMANDYKDTNLCHKDLHRVSDPMVNEWRSRIRLVDKPCVLLSGGYGVEKRFLLGYYYNVAENKYARMSGQPCLYPKAGIDIRYLAALLLIPSVNEQILSICDEDFLFRSNFNSILDWVIVPNHTEKERLSFMAEAIFDAMQSSQNELKKEHTNYKKAVRMRKHALTQKLTAMEATFFALNEYRIRMNGKIADKDKIVPIRETTVQDAFELIAEDIKVLRTTFDHIADVEYSFSKSEWINPEQFMEDYISKNANGWLNFKPVITWEKGHNFAMENLKDETTGKILVKKGDALNTLYFSKDALEKVMDNIIANAISHGFTDQERKDYQLRFSWHSDGIAIIVEVENNGTPIPQDRNTASLLEYGVSSALHKDGHNGIGCNEVDDIMRRYDGKVRIESSPKSEFSVKYVLIFERSNIFSQL